MVTKAYFRKAILPLGLLLLLILMFLALLIGPAGLKIGDVFAVVAGQDVVGFDMYRTIIFDIRLPRIVLAVIVGFALGGSGAVAQGLLRNPLADPFIIGISAGAALGAVIAVVSGAETHIGIFCLPLFAFVGALSTGLFVTRLAAGDDERAVYTLIIAGVAVSAFLNAIMSMLILVFDRDLGRMIQWMLGSFAGRGWVEISVSFLPILGGLLLMMMYARDLNAMLFGDEAAYHLGVRTQNVRNILVVVMAVTVGSAVAVSGTIGFVGLMIPHMVRLVVGPDHRLLIPLSAIGGAGFLLTADTIARVLIAPGEIPVGIVTAFFGGPFFIWLLLRARKRGAGI